jgi:hypothetical protein
MEGSASVKQMRSDSDAIVLVAGAVALGLAALCLALAGTDQEGTAVGLRATALLSFPFLVGVYAASALAALWPGELSEWLLPRRRLLGLAFSAVLTVHLVLIAHLLSLPPDPPPTVLGLTPGFVAYLFLAAMALASFSRIAKAIGPARTRLLFRVGLHWVFAIFTLALFKGVFIRHYYAWWLLPLMIAMAVYAMRLTVWWRASKAMG